MIHLMEMEKMGIINFKDCIKTYPDFPKKGVQFKDVTPILANKNLYQEFLVRANRFVETIDVDVIAGIDARGFWFACPLATYLNVGFIPIRKRGKLPGPVLGYECCLEYGTTELYIQSMRTEKVGFKVLIVDDILATGGTALASARLVEGIGGEVSGLLFVGEITKLKGRKNIKGYNVHSLVKL